MHKRTKNLRKTTNDAKPEGLSPKNQTSKFVSQSSHWLPTLQNLSNRKFIYVFYPKSFKRMGIHYGRLAYGVR